MISALLEGRPWASLVDYHVYNAWVLGAHNWWCGNGFTESSLISLVQDLQECRIALVLVIGCTLVSNQLEREVK